MVHWIVFLLIGSGFLFSSFQQGLFYEKEIYTWHVGMAVIFIIYMNYTFLKKEETMPSYLYSGVFLIPLCYLISFTNAVTVQGAFDQFIQWTLFAMFFVILVTVKNNAPGTEKGMLVLLLIFGIYIAFLPFLSSWGWLEYNDAVLNGRYSSVFQYPNTYAAITMALLLFHLMYIVLKKTSLWLMLLLSLPLVLYATTLFFSLSRGAMILFPIIWLVGLCFLRMREQVKYIVSTIWAFAGGLVFYIMGSQENAGSFSQLFMLLVAGGISALLVMGTCRILDRKMPSAPSKKWQAYLLPGIAVLAGAALVLDFVKQGILYSQLPEGIRHRLRDIGYETIFEDGRFTFFFDAFRMLKDAPLFGWGGDGWSVLYHSYQTEPYISNEVHSVLLEQLLNIGVIGLIVGTVVLAVYAVNSVRTFRKTAHPAIPAALTALLMLLGHGMIDFDFSFATVWLLFMLLLAIAVPAAPELPAFTIDRRSVAIGASGLAAVLVVLSSVYAFRFDIAERKAQAAAQLNGNEEILETLTDARAWNPNELSYIIDQASVAVELQKGDLLLELNNQFTDVEPLNSNAWLQSGNIYASFGRIEEAMERYEQALEYDPFNIDIYERIIHLTSEEAASLSQNGEKDKAAEVAAQAAGAYERYQSTMFEFRDNPQPGYKDLELNQSSIFLTGQAYMVQTKYQKGINVLQNVNKDNEELYLRSQALVIHALEKQGETQKAQTKLNNLISRNEQAAAYFEAYQQIF